MDRRTKKRIEILQEKRQRLRNQLSVVRRYPDDPGEIGRLETEIAGLEAELEKLKAS